MKRKGNKKIRTSFYLSVTSVDNLKALVPRAKFSKVLDELAKDDIILRVLVDRAIHKK